MNPEITAPNAVKRILCLANSRKLSGRCIAGRESVSNQPGAWIRPVSGREHQEVSWDERHYEDRGDPSVLDVIAVPLVEPRPHLFQQENWLLDPNFYWQKTGHVDWTGLQAFVEPDVSLWVNGQSRFSGRNNRVALNQATQLRDSLRLIRVAGARLEVLRPGAQFGNQKKRVEAEFAHAGTQYRFRVTDAVYEDRYRAMAEGYYDIGECCLTISLGEPYEGFAYKLIAAVIERAENEVR
jgi:hypothetical protein